MLKALDFIGQGKPEVLVAVRELAASGMSDERISQELASRYQVFVGRMAINRWLKDNADAN